MDVLFHFVGLTGLLGIKRADYVTYRDASVVSWQHMSVYCCGVCKCRIEVVNVTLNKTLGHRATWPFENIFSFSFEADCDTCNRVEIYLNKKELLTDIKNLLSYIPQL